MLQLKLVLCSIWHQNFTLIRHQHLGWLIYLLFSISLLLENGLLPAMLLPGDSLLFLAGILISQHVLSLPITLLCCSVAAWSGYELSYWQGVYLGKTQFIQRWLQRIPLKHHQRCQQLFKQWGFLALILARFTAFVRTLLPLMLGISKVDKKLFHYANALSSLLWNITLIAGGYYLSKTSLFLHYQRHFLAIFTKLPVVMLVFGIIMTIWLWKNKNPMKT